MANRFSIQTVFSAVDKISAPVSRMQNRLRGFTLASERGVSRISYEFNKLKNSMRGIKSGLVSLGKVTAGAFVGVGGLSTLIALMSKADVESQLLAKSVGVNVNELDALASAVSGAGFQFDNIIDLVEEMNNKLGESAGLEEITPVKESLKILGLSFKEINKLSPEKQFKRITDSALKMADAQKAAAAVDILFGGEANKIIGVLRQQGNSIDDIINKYKDMSFRTDESRKGALDFYFQIQRLTKFISSLAMEVSGLVAGALNPLIESALDWIKTNKELLRQKVSYYVQEIISSIKSFIEYIRQLNAERSVFNRIKDAVNSVSKVIDYLVKNSESILKIAKFVGILTASFFALKVVILAINVAMMANSMVLAIMGAIAVITALIVYWEDLKEIIIDVGKSIYKSIVDPIKEAWNWVSNLWDSFVKFNNMLSGSFLSKLGFGDISIKNKVSNNNKDFSGNNLIPKNANQNFTPRIVTPQQRNISVIENIQKNQTEITIKDQTGRAEITKGKAKGISNIKLQSTGGF